MPRLCEGITWFSTFQRSWSREAQPGGQPDAAPYSGAAPVTLNVSHMEIPAATYPAIATVTAALIAGAIGFLSTVLSKEQKTSEFRQTWVDALRSDISEFIGYAEAFAALIHFKANRHGAEKAIGYLEEAAEEFAKSAAVYYRIRLRLNPSEHITLLSALSEVFSIYSGKISFVKMPEIEMLVDKVAVESQKVLKGEWQRVKRGELAFLVTKYASLAILLVAAIAAFVGIVSHVSIT